MLFFYILLCFLFAYCNTEVKVCQKCLTEDNKVVQCIMYGKNYFPSDDMEHCLHLFHGVMELFLYDACVKIDAVLLEKWFPSLDKITWNTETCPCLVSRA